MLLKALIDRLHHFGYAIAAVIIVVLILGHLGGRPEPARNVGNVVPRQDSVNRELESIKSAVTALAIERAGVVMPYQAPAVAVLHDLGVRGGFSDAAYAAALSAIGRRPTAQAIHVSLSAPTPGPVLVTPPPSIDWAAWHHEDTKNATLEAINSAHINVSVVQEPIAPSRVKACYLNDGTAGLCYALLRRHQLDYDIGATKGVRGLQPTVGLEYRLKNTSFGLFGGVTLRAGKPTGVIGLSTSF